MLETLNGIWDIIDGFWNVMGGLAVLMLVNIILGSLDAMMKKGFDWKKFGMGFVKAGVIAICYLGVYIAGAFNQDIFVMTINEVEVNTVTAIYMIAIAIYASYAKQLLEKFSTLLSKPLEIE